MFDETKSNNLEIPIEIMLKNPHLDFKTSVSIKTGEENERTKTAKYKNAVFTIKVDKYTNFLCSPHKYYNNGEHNYNDFNLYNYFQVIKEWQELFNINPCYTKINFLEIAVNITSVNTTEFLNSIINHKGKPFNTRRKGNCHFKECEKQRYIIKTYDKGLQNGQPGYITRFEVKIIKMKELREIGIYTYADLLNIDKCKALGRILRSYFDGLMIYDPIINPDELNARERTILTEGRIPHYWEELRENHPENFYKKRNSFNKLVIKHSGRDLKKQIGDIITAKWEELSTITPEQKKEIETYLKQQREITVFNHSYNGLIPVINEHEKKRYCQFCEVDISHKKKGAKFCSKECKNNYTNPRLNPRNNLKNRLSKMQKREYLFNLNDYIILTKQQQDLLNKKNSIFNFN